MSGTPQPRGACSAPNTSNDQSRTWANYALDGELSILAKIPEGTNVNKPGNPIFVSMLKIASIVLGGYLPEHEAVNGVKKSLCTFTHIPQKEIDYQWQRAMQRAKPRHPKDRNRLPPPTPVKKKRPKPIAKPAPEAPKEKPWIITEYDLNTCETRILRQVPSNLIPKARYLAGVISEFLETGEIARTLNFSISARFETVNGTLVRIRFHKYSPSLADCVFVAVAMAGCSLWYPLADYKHGWWDFLAQPTDGHDAVRYAGEK